MRILQLILHRPDLTIERKGANIYEKNIPFSKLQFSPKSQDEHIYAFDTRKFVCAYHSIATREVKNKDMIY